jgi:PPOX class probable F420-dependent enzyme
MLRKPNPAVITTLRPDGQPVSAATWYLWDDGRILVNMDEGRKRLEHIRSDPRVALDVIDEGNWYTHVSIIGHIEDMREDTGLADIDRLSRQYTGNPYPRRDRRSRQRRTEQEGGLGLVELPGDSAHLRLVQGVGVGYHRQRVAGQRLAGEDVDERERHPDRHNPILPDPLAGDGQIYRRPAGTALAAAGS